MPIFERYPLIDGTFFLSPRAHSKAAIAVKWPAPTSTSISPLDSKSLPGDQQQQPSALGLTTPTPQPRPTIQYLNAVCLGCLEGWNVPLRCRGCNTKWTGSHLVVGSMYTYDIFAAMPCCRERLRCEHCKQLAIAADHRLEFFSDYSHATSCTSCRSVDYHFVKPLASIFSATA